MILTIIATMFVLGIVIFFHEIGHFWAAKRGGVRVESFSIGFPPKLYSFKKGETEYIISAIPFGGYVKMAGDNPAEGLTGEPWEFLSAPVWTRMRIVLAGPLLNFVLAIIVLSLIYMISGVPVVSNQIGQIEKGSSSAIAELQVKDKIIKVAGQPTNNWTDVVKAVSNCSNSNDMGDTLIKITILRGTKEIEKELLIANKKARIGDIGVLPYVPSEIETVVKDSPAYKSGIKAGDIVISINGKPVSQWTEMSEIIQQNPGKELILNIQRGEKSFPIKVTAEAKKSYDLENKKEIEIGAIGITSKTQKQRANPITAIWTGIMKTLDFIILTFIVLAQLLSGVLPFKLLAGPIGIIQMTGQQAQLGFLSLVSFLAFISVNLGVVNLLPLPILDGGHVMFLLIEKIRKKPLSLKTQSAIQYVGVALLLCLVVLVSYNDILRWVK